MAGLPILGVPSAGSATSLATSAAMASSPAQAASDVMGSGKVVKINTQTGVGVPGGFSGASSLQPTSLMSKLSSQLSAISSAKSKVLSALNSGQKGVTTATLKKLNSMESSVTSKMNAAAGAPDFTKYSPILPKPIDVPSTPNFAASGIKVPITPSTPSVPSTPLIPSTSGVNIPTPPAKIV